MLNVANRNVCVANRSLITDCVKEGWGLGFMGWIHAPIDQLRVLLQYKQLAISKNIPVIIDHCMF